MMGRSVSRTHNEKIIENKQVFVFDWDGTIFDSMDGKTISFSNVVTNYFGALTKEISPELVAAIYRRHSGKPRNEIFLECAQEVNLKLGQDSLDEMSSRLFVYNRKALASSKLFPDAMRFLSAAICKDIEIFISSSVPQPELEFFVKVGLPDNIFNSVKKFLGSSIGCNKGSEHLDTISMSSGVRLQDMIVFGDDEADYELSAAAGVDCILVDRLGGRFDTRFPNVIKNMDELC